MRIALCLMPERELAAELVVFTQTHAGALGGQALSLSTNRPRLELCSGELDEWSLNPELLADLAPDQPYVTHFGSLLVRDGAVVGPLGALDREASRRLISLQARAAVRLGLSLPTRWLPGILLGHVDGDRMRPALRADWTTTMEGRQVRLDRLALLRVEADGRAGASVASHPLGVG